MHGFTHVVATLMRKPSSLYIAPPTTLPDICQSPNVVECDTADSASQVEQIHARLRNPVARTVNYEGMR